MPCEGYETRLTWGPSNLDVPPTGILLNPVRQSRLQQRSIRHNESTIASNSLTTHDAIAELENHDTITELEGNDVIADLENHDTITELEGHGSVVESDQGRSPDNDLDVLYLQYELSSALILEAPPGDEVSKKLMENCR